MRAFIRKPTSRLAMAVALATGAAVGVTSMAAPAAAQKKKKESKAKADYSEAFVAAYSPVNELQKSDPAAASAQIPSVEAAISTDDDRFAAGGLIYNLGNAANDNAMRFKGLSMMVDSGKVPADNAGQYALQTGQLAYQLEDWAISRRYVQQAIDLGYLDNDPEVLIYESFFAEQKYAEGLDYLSNLVAGKTDAGQAVPEQWIKRGLAVAYNNQLSERANDFALMYVSSYPSQTSWGDAIAVQLNTSNYQNPEALDLLRLARRTDTFRDRSMYLEYVESADARRLPNEARMVLEAGIASGMLDASDPYIRDTLAEAKRRITADRSELASIESDARASGASLAAVTAAADVFLNYEQPAKAEEFYSKALTMPGANTPVLLTRLGMAQTDQGKYDAAQATFAKVAGARQALTRLWGAYAMTQATPPVPATPSAM